MQRCENHILALFCEVLSSCLPCVSVRHLSVFVTHPRDSEQQSCMTERQSSALRGVRRSLCDTVGDESQSQRGRSSRRPTTELLIARGAVLKHTCTAWRKWREKGVRKSRSGILLVSAALQRAGSGYDSHQVTFHEGLQWSWSQPMTPFYLFYGKRIQSGFWRISVHVILRHEVLSLNPLGICIHLKLFASLPLLDCPFKYLQPPPGYEFWQQNDCSSLRDTDICMYICVRMWWKKRGGWGRDTNGLPWIQTLTAREVCAINRRAGSEEWKLTSFKTHQPAAVRVTADNKEAERGPVKRSFGPLSFSLL